MTVRKTLPALACLAVAATAMINTAAIAEPGFPTACALREIRVITTIEDHGALQDVAAERLADATFKMLSARRTCYEGRVDVALKLYDDILRVVQARAAK